MAKKSNCYKKYGKEWSKELTEYTRKHFETMFAGYMKHIGDKDERYAIDSTFLAMKKYAALIPEEEKGKRIFLFSFSEFNMLGDPKGMAFDVAYNSVDELIDEGWAVD